MLRGLSEKVFWNLYAICYDSIAELVPYKEMQKEILSQICSDSEFVLLDAGCGSGNFVKLLQEEEDPPYVSALDASSVMLARAKKKCGGTKVEWKQHDLNEPLPFRDSSFDRIVCTNVLFALENPAGTLREFQRVLKPGGRIVLATPNRSFDTNQILKEHLNSLRRPTDWIKFLPAFFPLTLATLFNLVSKNKKEKHVYHAFTEEELRILVASARFSIVEMKPTYAEQNWLVVAEKHRGS